MLILPNLKRPHLTPLYCITSIGQVVNTTVAVRYRLPHKLIQIVDLESSNLTPSADRVLMHSNITTDFAVPTLENCRVLNDELVACPATVALIPWSCNTTGPLCVVEVKTHQADEFLTTPQGYAVRSSSPCHILAVNGSITAVEMRNGFTFVPFTRYSTLKCSQSMAVPLEIRGLEYTYSYSAKPLIEFNVSEFTCITQAE